MCVRGVGKNKGHLTVLSDDLSAKGVKPICSFDATLHPVCDQTSNVFMHLRLPVHVPPPHFSHTSSTLKRLLLLPTCALSRSLRSRTRRSSMGEERAVSSRRRAAIVCAEASRAYRSAWREKVWRGVDISKCGDRPPRTYLDASLPEAVFEERDGLRLIVLLLILRLIP